MAQASEEKLGNTELIEKTSGLRATSEQFARRTESRLPKGKAQSHNVISWQGRQN